MKENKSNQGSHGLFVVTIKIEDMMLMIGKNQQYSSLPYIR